MSGTGRWIVVILILSGSILAACRKEPMDTDETVSPLTGTRMQLTLDSVFLYASQVYLWNQEIPSYRSFDPRGRYGSILPELSAFKSELYDLSQLALNPATGKAFEYPLSPGSPRYSYFRNGNSVPGSVAGPAGPGPQVILKSTLLNPGVKKTAYIALGSFPVLSSCRGALDSVFASFAAAAVPYLVVDLRSNSGGYVETAQYLANLIAPGMLNGKLMFSEQFNTQMQSGKATILKHQPYLDQSGKPVFYKGRQATMADVDFTEAANTYTFDKKGRLETVKEIYFIVSSRTASASELLISVLRPYLKVKLIGEKTYGKPVGFFGINIDRYSVYLSGFLIRNAQGWSGYFEGIPPDVQADSGTDPKLGDPAESCLSKALDLINGQAASTSGSPDDHVVKMRAGLTVTAGNKEPLFVNSGMIEHRLKLKY